MSESNFTVIERAMVDWLEASGFEVADIDSEWLLLLAERDISLTALACAVFNAVVSREV